MHNSKSKLLNEVSFNPNGDKTVWQVSESQ